MHVAAQNREQFTKTLYFGSSRSFKVIDIDIPKKLVASACCDKQHGYAYLHHFYIRRLNIGKITFFRGGAPFWPPRSWGPPRPRVMKFCLEILETLDYHTVKTQSFYFTWAWNDTGT